MTVETRTTLEPKDINAIEFECRSCHAKVIRNLDDKLTVPINCSNCGTAWFLEGRPESGELGFFLKRLQYYSNGEFPYTLRFHVAAGTKA